MTDREKAIVMAHTGICMLTGDKFQIFHKYVEEIMGIPIMTHEMGWLADAIKEKSQADFLALCADESSSEEPDKWIPCSERLPDDLEPVNITWVNHNPESYYAEIKDKPFTATGVYFNGQWYWWSSLCTDILAEYSHNYSDVIDVDIEIIAWQPLPKSYKQEEEG
ncbi:MAG: DUF551 domain-containing protein [Lachnospiraceae bacterium]|nr:DUF551 domain-containing protein [Lachnospiraceae bacterium]